MAINRARCSKDAWSLLVCSVGISIGGANGYADTCLDTYVQLTDDPEEFVMRAVDFAFEGKPRAKRTTVEEIPGANPRVVRVEMVFEVQSVQKGELVVGSTVRVVGTEKGCECIKEFQIDRSYRIVALAPNSENGSALRLHYCDFIKEIAANGRAAEPLAKTRSAGR